MRSIRKACLDMLENEDMKRNIKEMIHPISSMIYKEFYIYIWFICIYLVFLLFLLLANLSLSFYFIHSILSRRFMIFAGGGSGGGISLPTDVTE